MLQGGNSRRVPIVLNMDRVTNKPPNTGRSCDCMPSSLSSSTFDLNLLWTPSPMLDGGTDKSKRRLGLDSTFFETPRCRTLGSPLILVDVIGSLNYPCTYASRKSEAGDPAAKNRLLIFLMSTLRSSVERKRGVN